MNTLTQKLTDHLNHIAHNRDPYFNNFGHFYVQQYIYEQFKLWGEVEKHYFDVKGKKHNNLILNLSSICNEKKPIILIGAHYDAVFGSPGADDNATGIAVLLELGRALYRKNTTYPIRLVAFDMEEFGLLGSTAYATKLNYQKQRIRLMISLEMLGYRTCDSNSQTYPLGLKLFYPSQGNFIALVGNFSALFDLVFLSSKIRQTIPCEWLLAGKRGVLLPNTRRSDHAPFWDYGYRGIMITDTANLRNPHYHKPSDTISTLDLDFLTQVCHSLTEGIYNLSKS